MPAFLFALVLALTACERSGSTDPDPPQRRGDAPVAIKTIQVTDSIYMLEGKGGNIGVSVGADGVLIIDDQFENMSDAIKAAIAKLSASPLVYVLNTHHHGDHTGGNAVFGAKATIVSHENARKHLVESKQPAAALPVITFDSHMSIHFNGEEIRLVHLPGGHTDGDTAVFFTKSNVVHMGDNFFNKRLPFIDLNSGGHPKKLIASTNKLLAELPADIKIIPGHGPLATMADYKAFRDLMVEAVAEIDKAKAAGKTVEQVKKAGFGGRYKALATSFITEAKFAEILYQAP